jgi:hypothetical protein
MKKWKERTNRTKQTKDKKKMEKMNSAVISILRHWLFTLRSSGMWRHIQNVRKVWNQWEFYLLLIIYITSSIYSPGHSTQFSQPLYQICAELAQHIGIDSSTRACNSLPKVTKISDFNSIHNPWRPQWSTISTLSSNVNAIFSILTFNFNV